MTPDDENMTLLAKYAKQDIGWMRCSDDAEFPYKAQLQDGTQLRIQDTQDFPGENNNKELNRYFLFVNGIRQHSGFDTFPETWNMGISKSAGRSV